MSSLATSSPFGSNNQDTPNRFSGAFPDPYLDYASTQMPRSIYDVFRWAEHLWLTYSTYRMAAQRVVRYFLTKVELTDASDDEKEKYEDFLTNQLKIMEELAQSGDNFMAYGNDFISLSVPFRRYLSCPKCKLERPITKMTYTWNDYKFHSICNNPKCNYKGEFSRIDRNSMEQDPIKIIHWPPQEIRLLHHPLSGKTVYMWEIPGAFKSLVEQGNTFYLENTAWEVIEAIKSKKLFRFNDEVIYHLKDSTVAGVKTHGWGIPLVMSNFKQAWLIQVLKRYNEAIALDYIIPFRVVTPDPGSSKEADPVLHMNLGKFYGQVQQMFRDHRKDPTTLQALPFPIKMELLGADGKNLAPTDLIDKATDEFLNGQGVPAELYRGSMRIDTMPAALRLFERTWVHLVVGLNNQINWLFKRVSDLRNWENLKGRLQPITFADDLERKQIQLQLAAGQKISNQTALAPFGISFRDEVKRILEEQEYQTEQQLHFQEEQEQKSTLQNSIQQGAMGVQPGMQPGMPGQPMPQGQPGQPMQPGMMPQQPMASPAASVTPEDLTAQAETIAHQLLTMPYGPRRSELLKIKKSNETLHSIVVAKMNGVRQEAKTQGGYQVMQQMTGQPS